MRGDRVIYRFSVAALVTVHTLMLAWSATRHSPTTDEAADLPAGISHWRYGEFDLVRARPPLVRMVGALPVLAAGCETDWSRFNPLPGLWSEFLVGEDFVAANGRRSMALYTLARWACIPFSLAGAWVCLTWAKAVYGPGAGLLALSLWCLSPNILGHGQLITPDVGAAALGAWACFAFRAWLARPTYERALVAGLALGLAELTKFIWIILLPLWPLIWGLRRLAAKRGTERASPGRELLQLAAMFAVAIVLINFCYVFEDTCHSLGSFRFVSQLFSGREPTDVVPAMNRFHGTMLASCPVPLPGDFVQGIDVSRLLVEKEKWSYLLGTWKIGGWWYFYFLGLLVKVPIGTWLLLVAALLLRLTRRTERGSWREDVLLLLPAAAVVLFLSSQTRLTKEVRHVLPMFPFMIVWISQVMGVTGKWRFPAMVLVGGGWAWSALSSLFCYPHGLSYFNELAGGWRNGHRVLIDSNLDWGQDLLYLEKWLEAHPEAHPLGLAYLGGFDPYHVGMEFSAPPIVFTSYSNLTKARPGSSAPGPLPGWYAVSVSLLKGRAGQVPVGDGTAIISADPVFNYFDLLEPFDVAGQSIYIYRLEHEQANAVRRQLGLPAQSGHGMVRSDAGANSVETAL